MCRLGSREAVLDTSFDIKWLRIRCVARQGIGKLTDYLLLDRLRDYPSFLRLVVHDHVLELVSLVCLELNVHVKAHQGVVGLAQGVYFALNALSHKQIVGVQLILRACNIEIKLYIRSTNRIQIS